MNIIHLDTYDGSLNRISASNDPLFTRLIDYIIETPLSSSLLDPSFNKVDYTAENFYYTKQDDLYYYITFDANQSESDYIYEPTIILLNTLYGILEAFNYMAQNKIHKFSITKEYRRYVFQAEGIESIVIDPSLGNLYNNTISRIIMRRINKQWMPNFIIQYMNKQWVPEFQSNNNVNGIYVANKLIDQELQLFYDLIIKQHDSELLGSLYTWASSSKVHKKQSMVLNNVRIQNWGNIVYITPSKKRDQFLHLPTVTKGLGLFITIHSLISFLEAWERKLQYSDAFTLVFLGKTLRFFEGEPLLE